MNQNSLIAFALLVGFVVFVTMRGELQRYLAVIGLAPGTATAGGATGLGLPALPNLGNLPLPYGGTGEPPYGNLPLPFGGTGMPPVIP